MSRPPRAVIARPDASDVAARFGRLVGDGAAELPLPGGGQTAARFAALFEVAATDLSLGRLLEAHADALAICAEAGRPELAEGRLAVWASVDANSGLEATAVAGGWRLAGTKRFCGGSTIVDRALVTAHAPDGSRLFLVDLAAAKVEIDTSEWATSAFVATATGTVRMDTIVPASAAVGDPEFYLARPGFWHGAVGVAACWAGGAHGLVDRFVHCHVREEPHGLVHLGAARAESWAMRAVLDQAASEIDADPQDRGRKAMIRALAVRHVVERGCQDVLTRLGRAGGPRPAIFDGWFAQQSADLSLYLRQCHAERDLEILGRSLLCPTGATDR